MFRLEINACDDPFPNGSPSTIVEGPHGSGTYANATECNAAAKAALEEWLNANCAQWKPAGVTSGTFEGDSSGIEMYTYSETATMNTGQEINLIAQVFGVKKK
jgi:hypothetical protein